MFHDLVDLVGDESMRFTVYPFGGFLVRRFDQAKDRPAAFVQPVLFVLNSVSLLRLQVLHVRLRDGRRGRAIYLLVDIHIERHLIFLLSYLFPYGQETFGFQSLNMPNGFSRQIHACSMYTPKPEFRWKLCPSTDGGWVLPAVSHAAAGTMYSTATN
jgi:hypothetical protein